MLELFDLKYSILFLGNIIQQDDLNGYICVTHVPSLYTLIYE
jgi:hypothetical protein